MYVRLKSEVFSGRPKLLVDCKDLLLHSSVKISLKSVTSPWPFLERKLWSTIIWWGKAAFHSLLSKAYFPSSLTGESCKKNYYLQTPKCKFQISVILRYIVHDFKGPFAERENFIKKKICASPRLYTFNIWQSISQQILHCSMALSSPSNWMYVLSLKAIIRCAGNICCALTGNFLVCFWGSFKTCFARNVFPEPAIPTIGCCFSLRVADLWRHKMK